MGNRLSFGAECTREAEILQSPSTKDEAKAAGGYMYPMFHLEKQPKLHWLDVPERVTFKLGLMT